MDIHVVSRPKPGEIECGDQYLVLEENSHTLLAVIDGLGHGPNAAIAANATCEFIRHNTEKNPEQIILECDKAINHTRGVALTILKIDRGSHELYYAGVGNVEMYAKSAAPIRPINYPGVVGHRIRRLQETRHKINKGDLLTVFTDGISSRFDLKNYLDLDARRAAETIMLDHSKDHDDATCAVILY